MLANQSPHDSVRYKSPYIPRSSFRFIFNTLNNNTSPKFPIPLLSHPLPSLLSEAFISISISISFTHIKYKYTSSFYRNLSCVDIYFTSWKPLSFSAHYLFFSPLLFCYLESLLISSLLFSFPASDLVQQSVSKDVERWDEESERERERVREIGSDK